MALPRFSKHVQADFVRLFHGNPDNPDDLSGMAIVPHGATLPDISVAEMRRRMDSALHRKGVQPDELDKRLRELTPDFPQTAKAERAEAVKHRDALIALGGTPTRPIRDFEPEEACPETVELYDIEHGMYELYGQEESYWSEELECWEWFLKWRQSNFHRSKRKGLLPSDARLPDPKEIDPVELLAEYLAYQQGRIQRFDARKEAEKKARRAWLGFYSECDRRRLENRLHLIERQLQEIQQEKEIMGNPENSADAVTAPPTHQRRSTSPARSIQQNPALVHDAISRGTKRKAISDPDPPTAKKRAIGSLKEDFSNKTSAREHLDHHKFSDTKKAPRGVQTLGEPRRSRRRGTESRKTLDTAIQTPIQFQDPPSSFASSLGRSPRIAERKQRLDVLPAAPFNPVQRPQVRYVEPAQTLSSPSTKSKRKWTAPRSGAAKLRRIHRGDHRGLSKLQNAQANKK